MQNALSADPHVSELLALARDPTDAARAVLFGSIAALFERGADHLTPAERALMREIMRRLVHQVEMSVRLSLAERLAGEADAPHDLILLLANDRIEVAQLVLERSRVLTEDDLIEIVRAASLAHQKVVAGRPDVTERVAAALAASTSEEVLAVLLRNSAARIAEVTLLALAERAAGSEALGAAMLQRPGLPRGIAERLYATVSETLKAFILQHFDVDPRRLGPSVAGAASAAAGAPASSAGKLIDKLAEAG